MATALSAPLHTAWPGRWEPVGRYGPGLALSALLAGCAMVLGQLNGLQAHGVSALTLAIVLGMLVGNTVYPRMALASGPGVQCAKQNLLRLGVVLYGLRLTTQDIASVGLAGVLVDALVLGSTFALACYAGIRWLGLDRNTAMLIGIGSSICGAAAVMAAEPVLRARAEQVTVAVATVVVFGTLAIFVYPLLFQLNLHWQLVPGGAHGFGVYAGSTIHEVAQVVAAGRSIGAEAADAAVIAKMVRVMMLAPVLLALSAWRARHTPKTASQGRLAVPWFAFGFIGVVLFNSLQLLPTPVLAVANAVDNVLLAMAMAALGLATPLAAIRKAGIKPLLLAGGLFAWLLLGGALINRIVPAWLG
ncbi:putative integral membrane protein (TIGR00698 family) [Rhodoferax ferrireducens]|uniref:Integral membrane protein (TIGR00698 family) n=1 Tax=Rhodoferax ferrireducens TaxID=192843 RepID=A0ABU2C9S5_9BURK|nr:YeiH family protein [Rhodoferax ferrireducens]MDR7378085.1 putative integral membrane protein (TIGR00698 family) [Rhodoferax ferrireducens]